MSLEEQCPQKLKLLVIRRRGGVRGMGGDDLVISIFAVGFHYYHFRTNQIFSTKYHMKYSKD